MLLSELVAKSKRSKALNHSRADVCPSCAGVLPRKMRFELGDLIVCRVCYLAATGKGEPKLKYCPRCRTEKPSTKTYFYRKMRGTGAMRICRSCRDSELRRHNKRMCGTCWKPWRGNNFTVREWCRPQPELAICITCTGRGKAKVAYPRIGEKLCPRCAEVKTTADFYIVSSRVSAYCKPCTRAYNKERYEGRRDSGEFPARTTGILYHLQAEYTEQQLVDMWGRGESPKIPKKIRAPKANFAKATNKELKGFMVGHERGLGLKGSAIHEGQTKETMRTPRMRIRIKKRKKG